MTYQLPPNPTEAGNGYGEIFAPTPMSMYDVVVAEQAARKALNVAIISIFLLGAILGPLAIKLAKDAEAQGADAKAARIIGWLVAVPNVFLMAVIAIVWVIGAIAS